MYKNKDILDRFCEKNDRPNHFAICEEFLDFISIYNIEEKIKQEKVTTVCGIVMMIFIFHYQLTLVQTYCLLQVMELRFVKISEIINLLNRIYTYAFHNQLIEKDHSILFKSKLSYLEYKRWKITIKFVQELNKFRDFVMSFLLENFDPKKVKNTKHRFIKKLKKFFGDMKIKFPLIFIQDFQEQILDKLNNFYMLFFNQELLFHNIHFFNDNKLYITTDNVINGLKLVNSSTILNYVLYQNYISFKKTLSACVTLHKTVKDFDIRFIIFDDSLNLELRHSLTMIMKYIKYLSSIFKYIENKELLRKLNDSTTMIDFLIRYCKNTKEYIERLSHLIDEDFKHILYSFVLINLIIQEKYIDANYNIDEYLKKLNIEIQYIEKYEDLLMTDISLRKQPFNKKKQLLRKELLESPILQIHEQDRLRADQLYKELLQEYAKEELSRSIHVEPIDSFSFFGEDQQQQISDDSQQQQGVIQENINPNILTQFLQANPIKLRELVIHNSNYPTKYPEIKEYNIDKLLIEVKDTNILLDLLLLSKSIFIKI